MSKSLANGDVKFGRWVEGVEGIGDKFNEVRLGHTYDKFGNWKLVW